jgi:hypothetical protein
MKRMNYCTSLECILMPNLNIYHCMLIILKFLNMRLNYYIMIDLNGLNNIFPNFTAIIKIKISNN